MNVRPSEIPDHSLGRTPTGFLIGPRTVTSRRVVARSAAIWLAALALGAPAASAADSTPFADHPAPLGASASFDGRSMHLGLDSRFAWTAGSQGPAGAPNASGGFALEGLAGASRWTSGNRPTFGTAALLSASNDRHRAWLGLATRERREAGPEFAKLYLGAGVARALRSVTVEASAYAMRAYVPGDYYRPVLNILGFPDSTMPGPLIQYPARDPVWTTGQMSLRWRNGPGALAVTGGVTLGDLTRPRRWGHLAANLQLTPAVSLDLTVGQRAPATVAFDPMLAPGTALAFTWTPGARHAASLLPAAPLVTRDWQLARIRGDAHAVHLRCARAQRIEIRGDFTDWDARPMLAIGDGWWEFVGRMTPGLQKVQVRIEGGPWFAPDDLPRTRDGEREAGTFVVPD
jgi:hypothetical protein